jgi:triosephosphate isomerase
MRTPLLAGNWKLNCLSKEARELATAIVDGTKDVKGREILLAPTYTSLSAVAEVLRGTSIGLGAQDVFWEDSGAFTGEISAPMLKDAGCTHIIIGHSERRQHFGDTDYTVARKVAAAARAGLSPLVCVGETLEQRDQNVTMTVIERQVAGGLVELPADAFPKLIIAYEPVWAIGTGRNATPEQAEEVHAFIRDLLKGVTNTETAANTRILYGGSVKPDNVDDLMACPNVDGALVGGASLKAKDFLRIVHYLERPN